MSSTSQFGTKAAIEKDKKGGELLGLFAKNPNGPPVGSTKKRTTINVSLPAAAVAAVAKSDKANKKRRIRRSNQRQISAAQTIAMLKILPP